MPYGSFESEEHRSLRVSLQGLIGSPMDRDHAVCHLVELLLKQKQHIDQLFDRIDKLESQVNRLRAAKPARKAKGA